MSWATCYTNSNPNPNPKPNPNPLSMSQYGWQNCYNASNNYDFNSPAKMADGRLWSQWQPDAEVNERLQRKEGIQSNWQYRQFLQHNGLQIMNFNTDEACYALGLDPHYTNDSTPSSNVPYKFKGTFDTGKPGFGYCNSDLKNPYLSREQLNARLISPSINPANF